MALKAWQVAARLFSKKGRPRKDRAQKHHTMRRCHSRFRRKLTEKEYQRLVRQIIDNRARFVEKQSRTVTVWEVEVYGIPAIAIFDKKTKAIRTLMPLKMYAQMIGKGDNYEDI